MNKEILRMRMFAGPNGSGKSTIQSMIKPDMLGIYVNPDNIEKEICEKGFLDFRTFGLPITEKEVLSFFSSSSFLKTTHLLSSIESLKIIDEKLIFHDVKINAYFASIVAGFIRNKLIEHQKSFSFETVMSFPDKVELLQSAQKKGYRTYLYYVATKDPFINIFRVKYRVKMGGHFVPEDKIIARYQRSLDLLMEAVQFTNRAYIFDNSGLQPIWLAEVTDGRNLEMKTDHMPEWFKNALWNKFKAKIQNR